MADNFKRVSATGTGSLVVIATVPASNLSTTPPTEPATFILKNVTVSNKSGGAVTAEVSINDSSASVETHILYESVNNNAVKHLTTTQVLEQGDTVKVKGSGLKFSINFMEIV